MSEQRFEGPSAFDRNTEATVPPYSDEQGQQSALGEAKETASQVVQQAQEKLEKNKGHVQSQVREELERRSHEAGGQIGFVAQAMRRSAQDLRDQGKEAPAGVFDRASEAAERVAAYLSSSDADRVLHDAEDLARRRPALVITGAAISGFLAARFIGASSRRRYALGDTRPPQVTRNLVPVPEIGTSGESRTGPGRVGSSYEAQNRGGMAYGSSHA